MEEGTTIMQQVQISEAVLEKHVYSVWALPPEHVRVRVKKLMEGLRSEFDGPHFEPHVTVIGAIRLTEAQARDLFKIACQKLKPYSAKVEKIDAGTFYYQCVYLLLKPTTEVVEASDLCCSQFGYNRSGSYMPHLSLIYGDLTDEEKKKAQEKAYILDEGISSLSFPISHLALCKTDTEDKSCKSWVTVEECSLQP
ncbi:Cyclic phosphodiesterase [Capsicum annuum]|nr:Cyclic phosphodiesterase [Capsicum annuum]